MLLYKITLLYKTMTNIYILKLQHGKYYVGKTDNIEKRKQQHINGTACSWTKKYKLILVEQIISNASDFDEDKYTKEYMDKFGIDNVRGGSYVTEELDEGDKYTIQREIWGAKNLCKQCGRSGHFIKSCTFEKDVNGNNIYENCVWCCEYCNKEYETEDSCEKHEKYCNNKKSINGRYCNKEFETQKGAIFHENVHCKNKNKNTTWRHK